jgi:Na+-driven multidrug efflux pump
LGAGDKAGAEKIARTAIVANTWLGVGCSLFVYLTAFVLLSLMNLPTALFGDAVPFLELMGGTLFLEAFNTSISGVLRAHKHTRDAMYVGLGQNAINLFGSLLFIYGWFGAPCLGVLGVAVAGVFSRFCASFALMSVLSRRVGLRLVVVDFVQLNWERVRRVLRIGLPAAAEISAIGRRLCSSHDSWRDLARRAWRCSSTRCNCSAL